MKQKYFWIYGLLCINLCAQTMISIPSGSYIMGTYDEYFSSAGTTDQLPDSIYKPHEVELAAFKVSEYEIAAKLFLEFLQETGPSLFDTDSMIYRDLLKENAEEYANYAAVSTYFYALDFCMWLSKKHNKHYRLATEAEWEYAATGGKMQAYPWGKEYQQLSNQAVAQRLPLDSFKEDISSFGVKNMYGNVAEWVLDYFQSDFYVQSDDIYNPVCIDGKQVSIDKKFTFAPMYVVRGDNYYFYDERMEVPIKLFTGVKRRYGYYYNMLEPFIKIGFRIVEYNENDFFFSKGKKMFFSFSEAAVVHDTNLFFESDCMVPPVYRIKKGSRLKTLFYTSDSQKKRKYCVQFFNLKKDISGMHRGDNSAIGWISAEALEFISNK